MFAGQICVLAFGAANIGGFSNVLQINKIADRLAVSTQLSYYLGKSLADQIYPFILYYNQQQTTLFPIIRPQIVR